MNQRWIPPSGGLDITPEEVARLPLRLRVAYGAAMVEKCIAFYSEYFIRRFLQRDAVDYAWNFALGRADDPEHRRDLMEQIGDLIEENEEYDFGDAAPPALVLEEIDQRDGESVTRAVEYAELNYADARFYREGIHPGDAPIATDDYDSCSIPFRNMASQALLYATTLTEHDINRNMFDKFRVDFCRIPEHLRRVGTLEPPRHELNKWKHQGDALP